VGSLRSIDPLGTLFDHHVHTDRSDGTKSLADRAASVKLRPHGVSDHFPWPNGMQGDDDVLRYLEEASSLGLRVGIEYDLGVAPELRPTTRDALHYVIGALHQIEVVPGEWIDFNAAGAFNKGRTKTFAEAARFVDAELQHRIRERLLEEVRKGIERDGIDIVGHATMGPLAALGDPETTYPAEWQERFIRLCVENDVAIEVNECYGVPHREFLERAHALGARFSVGTDSHFSIKPIDKTMAMVRGAGLDEARFLAGERVRPVRG
jgi:histidinol phosphatase-like PHP family hydrolase